MARFEYKHRSFISGLALLRIFPGYLCRLRVEIHSLNVWALLILGQETCRSCSQKTCDHAIIFLTKEWNQRSMKRAKKFLLNGRLSSKVKPGNLANNVKQRKQNNFNNRRQQNKYSLQSWVFCSTYPASKASSSDVRAVLEDRMRSEQLTFPHTFWGCFIDIFLCITLPFTDFRVLKSCFGHFWVELSSNTRFGTLVTRLWISEGRH